MTTIVGLVHEGIVYIGSDSQVTSGWTKRERAAYDGKVFVRENVVFGCGGASRFNNLMRHEVELPARISSIAMATPYITKLIVAMRTTFKGHDFREKDDHAKFDGKMLVGVAGKLYCIDIDYSFSQLSDGYDAIGTGADFALGALAVMSRTMQPQKRVLKALQVAAKFDIGSSAPFTINAVDCYGEVRI